MSTATVARRRRRPGTASAATARRRATCRCWPRSRCSSACSAIGGVRYEGFSRPAGAAEPALDNAFLIVLAVGMTFVILTGGIDLSVGVGRGAVRR